MAVSSVSFNNTPQAGDDLFLSGGITGTGITEDTLSKIVCLNVMANDLGGNAKKLYSIDDGLENDGVAGADLLVKDATGAISYSQGGARISITSDGKISYDTGGWKPEFKSSLAQLGAGESAFDTFTYAIQMGNGTLSWATVRVEVAGSNDAPTVSVADLCGAVTEDATLPNLSDTGTITFDDLDLTDTHSVSVTAGANTLGGVLNAIISAPATGAGAGTVTWTYTVANSLADHLAQGQTVTESFTIRIADNHGGFIDQVVNVKITGTNDGPQAVADVGKTSENQSITIDVLANDTDLDDGHVLTLTTVSVDPGQGSVSIVGNQLQFDPGTDFDYLPAGIQTTVTVHYTMKDEFGATSNSTVAITVTGTNDAPHVTSGDTGTVAENAPTSTVVYAASATDSDVGDSVTWSLTGADAAAFDIDSSGNVTLKNSADYETKSAYHINVVATDNGLLTDSKAVTINVTNVNEAPTVTSGDTGTVAENAPISTIVYAAAAADPDAGDHITWSLTGTDAGAFDIDADGNVTLKNSADYEAKDTYQINVVATDDGLLTDSKAVTINVTNVNEAPSITSGDSGSVAENAVTSTIVYAAAGSDPDAGDHITWSLSGADAAAFDIDSDGNVTLKNSANFEGQSSYSINVVATDDGLLTDSKAVTINVTNVNEAPAVTSSATGSVAENAPISTVVYAAAASDPDAGDHITWSLSGADAAAFDIDADGNVTLKNSADYEAKDTYQINVVATDDGLLTDSKAVTINVTNVNEAPSITSGDSGSVAENAPISTIVYAAAGSDPDAGDHITWSLTGTDAGAFDIDSDGNVTLKASANFEGQSSYSINVVATDDGLLADSKAVTINVTNVNEAPAVTSGATGSVAENAPISTVVYAASATDPDAGDNITWSLSGADAGAFNIDADGNVTLKASANFEGQSSYSINVVATDDGLLTDSKAVTINVTNVNEAPTVTSGATGTVAENAATSTIVYAASATDPDAGDHIAWSLTGADAAAFDIDADGNVTLKNSANFEGQSSYSINVVATDDGLLTDSKAVTINVTNVNEAPSVTSGATGSVAENAATSTIVYAASATDPDAGDSVTWSLTGADAGAFTIDSSGNVRLNSSANYEAKSSYAINVVATDNGLLTDSKAVTINVTNVNEAPTVTSGATGSVAENAATSTIVYAASATDPDAGDHIAWSLTGTDAGAFTIDSSGNVRLNSSANFEAKASYSINVIATDDGLLTNSKAVNINVTNVNEAPSVTSGATGTVAENAPAATVVYTATATDPDAGDSIAWSLSGTDAGAFNIDSSGKLRLNNPADYETKSSYSLNVIATDLLGLTSSKAVTINITDVNEAPPNVAPDAQNDAWVLSDTAIATNIITADWFTRNDTDADGNPIYVTAVSGLPAGLTAHFDGAGHLDYVSGTGATAGSYTLSYTLSDGAATDTANVSLTVLHTTNSGSENYTLDGNDFSYVDGQSAADTLTGDLLLSGNAGIDTFVGSAGDDILSGGAGDDFLIGGGGSDRLIGGAGADRLTGNNNGDTFVYQATSESTLAANDVITDFTHNSDKVDLSAIDAAVGGADNAFAFGGNNANTVANSVTWSESGGNTIIHIDNTGDTTADMQITLTGTGLGLQASDFIL